MGDCLEIMQQLIEDGVKVDLVLTDPPYGLVDCSWDKVIPFDSMWNCLNNISTPITTYVFFTSEPFGSKLKMSNIDKYKYDWYWIKSKHTGFLHAKNKPLTNVECISIFSEGGIAHKGTSKTRMTYNPQGLIKVDKMEKQRKSPSKHGKENNVYSKKSFRKKYYKQEYTGYPKQTLDFDVVNSRESVHPTQKPVKLLEYLIKTYSNEGDTVLDFTMGSGSTGVACMNLNRKFIGIELEEEYYNIAEQRLMEATHSKQTTLI